MISNIVMAITITLVPKMITTEPSMQIVDNPNRYVVRNPLKVPVVMALDCGKEWETVLVPVEPNSYRDIWVVSPNSDKANKTWCFFDKWTDQKNPGSDTANWKRPVK